MHHIKYRFASIIMIWMKFYLLEATYNINPLNRLAKKLWFIILLESRFSEENQPAFSITKLDSFPNLRKGKMLSK